MANDKVRILLIDDDIEFLEVTSELLESYNYYTRSATTIESAFQFFESDNFDIILCDYRMRGSDSARQLALGYAKNLPRAKFYFFTGFDDITISDAKKIGAHGILHKPVSVDKLIETLENILKVPYAKAS